MNLVVYLHSFYKIDRVKALGLNDRKLASINSIQTNLRSFNRRSFHAGQYCKNFVNRLLFLFFLIVPFLLSAQEMTIESGQVEYSDTDIILSKQVLLQNEVGRFQAEWVKWDEEKGEMTLKEDVECHFAEGMTLKCQNADFSLQSLKLSFSGDVELFDETYSLMGPEVLITLALDKRHIQDLEMQKGVKCEFKNEFALIADSAHYVRADDAPVEEHLFGMLRFSKGCGVNNANEDRLVAEEMAFDFGARKLVLAKPCGLFHFEKLGNLDFVAGLLSWEKGIIKLQECVTAAILFEGVEKYRFDCKTARSPSDEGVELHYNSDKTFKQLICRGETDLTVNDQRQSCTFICSGEIIADEREVKMKSLPKKQIYFQDGFAKIASDAVFLAFDDKKTLSKVLLEGNVLLVNRLTQLFQVENPLQYAVADAIEYIPETKEITLTAVEKQRVLFLDRVNHLEISAPGLRIKRTTGAQKGYIQGLGDVRFSFAKTEMDRIHELFPNIKGR